ncbi:hypothetical protein TRICI_005999 [Trichomonascus ciferrii]|uniref:Uncharacterized protein n=1 Tax=Trichomonascus ciferrii TaxID=44093 RepID=A0A642UU15_9ASCO|nr:hypothetical protein TRICI_005999 [Trichomonascus ciferrii]
MERPTQKYAARPSGIAAIEAIDSVQSFYSMKPRRATGFQALTSYNPIPKLVFWGTPGLATLGAMGTVQPFLLVEASQKHPAT